MSSKQSMPKTKEEMLQLMESEKKEILNINVSAWHLQCAIGFILSEIPTMENEQDKKGMSELVMAFTKELNRARLELKK